MMMFYTLTTMIGGALLLVQRTTTALLVPRCHGRRYGGLFLPSTTRCFVANKAKGPGNGNSNSESKEVMRAREREVFDKVKVELRQGYRWLQRLERNEPLVKDSEGLRGQKKKKKNTNKRNKRRSKKGKNNKKKKNQQFNPWFDDCFDDNDRTFEDYFGNTILIPDDHVLIGKAKSSLKLTASDVAELDAIVQPNPYNSRYKALRWVGVKEATEIANVKYGGPDGFLDMLVRMAGVKNKQRKGKSSEKELAKLKASSPNANIITNAKEELRDKYRLPLYTNDLFSLRSLTNRTGTTTLINEKTIEACERLHFLMTFTEFPLIRNERSSLLMWISRYAQGVDDALAFEALPNCMHTEVKRLWNEFFTTGKKKTTKDEMLVLTELESVDHQYNTTALEEIDAASRERALRFIDLGLPNAEEASLVEDAMNGEFPSITSTFPFLFRIEWMPASGVGQGDMVFVNRDGTGFAVIEAKARTKHQASKVKHVKRQSEFYAEALRSELRHTSHQVYAGYVTDEGVFWLDGVPETAAQAVEGPDSYETGLVPITEPMDSRSPLTTETLSTKGSETSYPLELESRLNELEGMTIRGGLSELLSKYALPKSGRKADLIDRILKHEQQVYPNDDDGIATSIGDSLIVAPSRREQLEAMNIKHELKALCYLYGVRPKKEVKQEYVEAVWSYENSTPGISAGY